MTTTKKRPPTFRDRVRPPNPLAEALYAAIGGDDDSEGVPLREYRFGTLRGIWRETPGFLDIVALVNDEPGNGQFAKFVAYFQRRARACRKGLRFMEVLNERLAKHLSARGWERVGRNMVLKEI